MMMNLEKTDFQRVINLSMNIQKLINKQ